MTNVDKWSSANPWLGLASYTEGTPLFGRDKETEVLTDIIKNNLATIVFGKSGVGKSSLLGAGISPALREEMYIPVKIRLVHNSDVSYVEQIEEEVRKQVNCSDMLPDSVISLGLWDFFHRHNFYRKEDGEECTPVVILDQFEEIYTLTDEEHKPDIHIFFQELSSLLNDIKPDHIIEKEREYASSSPTTLVGDSKLKIKRVAASSLSYSDGINFRFVICLREDKLYLLERNSVNIPVLKANRFNLQALSIESAFAVIACPRPDLFTKAEAYAIIDKLADMGDEGVRTVDPAILSLFLYKYYEKRGTASADNIFADYYSEATKGISNRSIVFLENHLLTLGGYRNQIPLYDVLSAGVTEEEIRSLFSNVILRTEKRKGIDYIEFSHDRLCAEAKKNREERTMHEQARKARRRMMISVAIFAISSTMLSIVLWLTFKYKTSEEGRLSEIQQKEQLKIKNDSLALLDAMNKRQTDSLIVLNENNSIQKERIEQQRDEINKSLQKQQEQNKLLKEQLATIKEQQQEIEGLRSSAPKYKDMAYFYINRQNFTAAEHLLKLSSEYYALLYQQDSVLYRDDLFETYRNLGYLYVLLGDYSNSEKYYGLALENYERLFTENPDRYRERLASTQNSYGGLCRTTHDYENSEKMIKSALENYELLYEEDPDIYRKDIAWTYRNIMYLYGAMDDIAQYEKYLKLSMEEYSILYGAQQADYKNDLIDLRNKAVWLLLDKGNNDEAIVMAEETFNMDKSNDESKQCLAECHNRKAYEYANDSNFSNANNSIDKALSLVPNDAIYYDSKGEFLLMQGNNQEALNMWKKVLELNPNFLEDYPDGSNLSNGLKKLGLIN